MNGEFQRLLEEYGQRVTVCRGGEKTEARAFLQPVLERREDWRQELPTPIGVMRRDRWLYLGDGAAPLEEAEEMRILWQGHTLRIQTARPVYVGERLSHWWAVLDERDATAEEQA